MYIPNLSLPDAFMTRLASFIRGLRPAIELRGDGPNKGDRDDVKARIKEELKLAQKAGLVPKFCKFSVRKPDYNSIHVDLVQWEGQVFSNEYTEYLMAGFRKVAMPYTEIDFDPRRGHLQKFVPALTEVHEVMGALANRHNFDESDMMTDYFHVGYYLHCEVRDIETVAERAIRLESDPVFQELHARAVEAIDSLHPSCRKQIVESVFGRRGFESAGEWTMNDIIKIAERAAGKPMAYCKRQRGWRVVKEINGVTITENGEEVARVGA